MVILEKRVNGVAATELNRFIQRAQALAKVAGEVGVLITGNARVQELNRRFRRKNKPTDVLSFPRLEGGDIAISADIARENARIYGHRAADELKVLILHGMLHLAGYDHERDNGHMAAREARLRAQLKLPSALIERTNPSADKGADSRARAKRQSPKSTKQKSLAGKSPVRQASTRKRRSRP
ncbi:MAG TPA: rRNA maturation RNase YbeY [Candidatus Angelobacter sp.]|nr:rRNA maturation RNase YbeY [Candidatus Angelobacter sp.]